jgi:hypothetical protein
VDGRSVVGLEAQAVLDQMRGGGLGTTVQLTFSGGAVRDVKIERLLPDFDEVN